MILSISNADFCPFFVFAGTNQRTYNNLVILNDVPMANLKKHPAKLANDVQRIGKQVHILGNDIDVLFKKLRKQFALLDPKTKKKIGAGIAGLGTILAATALYRKRSKKK
jgi:hypothetical protein